MERGSESPRCAVPSGTCCRRPDVPGAIGGYAVKFDNEPGTWVFVYAFKDKASYLANAESPQMGSDYQRLRAALSDDPVWEDGEVISF